ncbi:hypothetical protein MKW94_006032 [Papaver nudicaule]|uniref:SEP domain-containing protein n=1 Tax=Papaver nudicaule TaxID=74823 RepID=A0AA41RUM0_PAPNU|nr:hypothetical protein [Papaver nudicaule]
MEFEAPARDFSRLSVSDDNPPPERLELEPMDFSELNWGSLAFTAGRNITNFDDFFAGKPRHQHVIKFYGNNFTVDGGPQRDGSLPDNIHFLENIKNYEIPEEFAEDGLHTINVLKHRKAPKIVFPEIPDERFRIC